MNRIEAFTSRKHEEIFHSVEHRHEIWKADPLDVETVHEPAREAFERLLAQATTPPGLSSGRILLLLGESGCGKTHLVRAFRNHAHGRGLGFVGYLQMTTAVANYPRYLLSNIVESLDMPYDEAQGTTTGWMKLAAVVANRADGLDIARIAGEELGEDELAEVVSHAADTVVQNPGYQDLDLDLVRALLYLLREDRRLKPRIFKYLRCEDLAPADQKDLGGLTPRRGDDAPERVVEFLGRLMHHARCALVVCVDQLEDMINFETAEQPFRRMVSHLCALVDRVPSSLVVMSCLDQYWEQLKGRLARSMIDRIEKDPAPISLESLRSAEEIEQIVARRLCHLYEEMGAKWDAKAPTDPVPASFLGGLTNLRTRDVLDRCREFREEWARTGRMPQVDSKAVAPLPPPYVEPPPLSNAWNDFRSSWSGEVPDDDEALTSVMSWAVRSCGRELPAGIRFDVRDAAEAIEVDVNGERAPEHLWVALCNKGSRGGGLLRQLKHVADAAHSRIPVVLRNEDFPSDPKTQVARELGRLIAERGGRRSVVANSDWRTILALRDFTKLHDDSPGFTNWLKLDRPLSKLPSLSEGLRLHELAKTPAAAAPRQPEAGAAPRPDPAIAQKPQASQRPALRLVPDGVLRVGTSEGIVRAPVEIAVASLTQHAAFLGSPGTGKTTVAMSLVEQLVLEGVPAILVDRKGDLAGYARDDVWRKDGEQGTRSKLLRDRIDVALFTPGNPKGRPLAIDVVPEDLSGLDPLERDEVLRYAANALGSMLGYRDSQKDRARTVIIEKAMRLLGELGAPASLEALIRLIGDQDQALVASIGRLDVKLFQGLAQDLETFRFLRAERLFSGDEKLDVDLLLGRGKFAAPGKTRLSVISTKFLGDNDAVQFWVTQLLSSIARWTSRHPSKELQAVLLMDEADLYLPAVGKPPTKEPMENLLKRARSSGLGLLLATQSPGDLDYKCRDQVRTWFVGRIREQVAMNKLKPLFAEFSAQVEAKLPKQERGQFHLLRESGPLALMTEPALVSPEQLPEDQLLALARSTLGPRAR